MLVIWGIFIYNIVNKHILDKPGKDRTDSVHVYMLNFLREHSRPIRKLLINQFGTAFLAVMLVLAIPDNNLSLHLWASIFSVCFLLYLNHAVLWEEGAKSRIRADAGREKYDPKSGLWMGIISALPAILFGCILTAGGAVLGNVEGLFGWGWAAKLSAISYPVTFFWQAQYAGIVTNIAQAFTINRLYCYFLTPLPTILGSFFSYWTGLRQWQLSSFFKLKKTENKKTANTKK